MANILSMETFEKLEEKMGTKAAKEVYQLAEAIHEELEKKFEDKVDQYKLRIQESQDNVLTNSDLANLKEQISEMLTSSREKQLNVIKGHLVKYRSTLSRISLLVLINTLLTMMIIFLILRPLLLHV